MTIIEVTVALAILGILTVIVAQCIVWSLHEQARVAAHQAALELAANTLETARAQAWPDLNEKWAGTLTVPSYMADLLPEGKLTCSVQAEQPSPHCRRIIVEVSWNFTSNLPAENVSLSTVLSERSTAKTGGEP